MLYSPTVSVLALVLQACSAVQIQVQDAHKRTSLPSFKTSNNQAMTKLAEADKWWAKVGDQVYHAPEASSGLSTNIDNYYYAMGSYSALTPELQAKRVGGEGRWHIFHLPHGAAMLQIQQSSDRRSSLSHLKKMRKALQLSSGFPNYMVSDGYENPLSSNGQTVEKAVVKKVTADNLSGFLKKLVALYSRSFSNTTASDESTVFLKSQLDDMGYTTCVDAAENVIAYVAGASSPADAVIVGAHFDSRPFEGPAPGAEDNGSGVAALLAMAKAFKDAGVQPQKSVYFVLFNGEELGMLGSAAFVRAYKGGSSDIPSECRYTPSFFQEQKYRTPSTVQGIVMDEVGWITPAFAKETVNLESTDDPDNIELMDHMADACQTHNGKDLDIVHNNAPFGSDHMSFIENGFAGVLAINGDDEAYPAYHMSTDTIDNVSPEYAAKIAKMNLGAVLRVAGLQA